VSVTVCRVSVPVCPVSVPVVVWQCDEVSGVLQHVRGLVIRPVIVR